MQDEIKIKIEKDEFWWGGCLYDSAQYPLNASSVYHRDLTFSETPSFINPLMISNKGKVVFCETGYDLDVKDGVITLSKFKGELFSDKVGETLKDAYLYAVKHFAPVSEKCVPSVLLTSPQYCTWIELMYDQTQEGVLKYARSIIAAGLPAGELIIDDGWMKDYGNWKFDKEKFPDPKAMFDELISLGFSPVLWLCGYVSPDSPEYRYLDEKGYLVKGEDGKSAARWWWNGWSAVLDFTNPGAVAWFNEQLQFLMDEYGVVGFKFDGCDVENFKETDIVYKKVELVEQLHLWNENAQQYKFNQIRQGFRNAGRPIVHSLCDKTHSWERANGIASIIPSMITASLLGYNYVVPDMIGGGNFANFLLGNTIDEELVSRWIALTALLPMEQFSLSLWNGIHEKEVKEFYAVRKSYENYFVECMENYVKTGEPIVRSLEYQYPNGGYCGIQDEFILGEKLLVAPVVEQGVTKRTVVLPEGEWLCVPENKVYTKGEYTFNADLDTLLYFEKQ